MTLIPFILDLADELNEFNRSLSTASGMDIDDFGFGIYATSDQNHFQQQQQQHQHSPILPQRRSRWTAPLFWVPGSLSFRQRHHPYQRGAKTACCNKSVLELEKELSEKETVSTTTGSSSATGSTGKSAYSVVNKHGFQVSMNVKQFASNELTVKTIDNCIVVEGQHDEKEDGHGVISRHFIRKYMLPKGYDKDHVLSTLSSDGILTVKAPPPPPPAVKVADEPLERVVVIQPTGGPAQLSIAKDAQTPTKELPPLSKLMPTTAPTTIPTPTPTPTTTTAAAAAAAVAASAAVVAAVEKELLQPKMVSANADALQKSAVNPVEQTGVGATLAAAAAETVANATEALTLQKLPETANGDAAIVVQQTQPDNKLGEISARTSTAPDGGSDTPRTAATSAGVNSAVGKTNESPNVNNGPKATGDAAVASSRSEDIAYSTTASTSSTATGLANNVGEKMATPTKTGELMAATDAAILFAKTQCENGSTESSFPAVTAVAAEKITN